MIPDNHRFNPDEQESIFNINILNINLSKSGLFLIICEVSKIFLRYCLLSFKESI